MAVELSREDIFLLETWYFRTNAEVIIKKMKKLNDSYEDKIQPDGSPSRFVDEILHSIFFLGMIHSPRISPERLVNERKRFDELKKQFPLPFELYSSQLPRRTPFSCVLDMIVFLEGRENENKIKKKLQEIIEEVHLKQSECLTKCKKEVYELLKNSRESKSLVSSTICISQNTKNPKSEKYYGVSMSTSLREPGRFMVAASCLPGSWDSRVADAVMTFNPNKSKKPYFDGTFKMPDSVTCKAYNLHEEEEKSPCESCKNLFYEGHFENATNAYGNCAEVESVSNLFKDDTEVREQARPSNECTDENRRKAEESVMEVLNNLPKTFKTGDYEFYTPQD